MVLETRSSVQYVVCSVLSCIETAQVVCLPDNKCTTGSDEGQTLLQCFTEHLLSQSLELSYRSYSIEPKPMTFTDICLTQSHHSTNKPDSLSFASETDLRNKHKQAIHFPQVQKCNRKIDVENSGLELFSTLVPLLFYHAMFEIIIAAL